MEKEEEAKRKMDIEGDTADAMAAAASSSSSSSCSDAMEVAVTAEAKNEPVAAETDDEDDRASKAGDEEEKGEKKAKKKGGAKPRVVDPIVDEHGNLIEHRIGGSFTTKKSEMSLPKIIAVNLAGITFKPKNIREHNGPRSFEDADRMEKKRGETRESVGVFDTGEYLDFAATIAHKSRGG